MSIDARNVFLVVYSVLWAASTPTYARLRAFAYPSFAARKWTLGRHARRRYWAAVVTANALPAAALAGFLWAIPECATEPLQIGLAAFAGTAAAAFPRLLHGVLASNRMHDLFYLQSEWLRAMREWDPFFPSTEEPPKSNNLWVFIKWAIIQLSLPVAAVVAIRLTL